MSQLRRYIEAGTSRLTQVAVERDLLRQVLVVNEYPKSGGTWVAKMLASVLDLPFSDNRRTLPIKPVVMRTHWNPGRLDSGVYVLRDGRDVMVSLFHHRCRRTEQDPRVAQAVNSVYPFRLDRDHIVDQLPEFIEVEMTVRTAGSVLSWPNHVTAALANPAIAVTRYEDLVAKPEDALAELVAALQPELRVPAGRISATVALHNRSNALSATHGMGSSAIRSASPGEWREVFSPESCAMFEVHAGDVLRAAGYSVGSRDA